MNLLSRDRILLIDDMPSIHEDFRGILTPDTASSGLSEVEHQLFGVQETAPPPAFVLDCAIGGEEGLELTQIRAPRRLALRAGIRRHADACRMGWHAHH